MYHSVSNILNTRLHISLFFWFNFITLVVSFDSMILLIHEHLIQQVKIKVEEFYFKDSKCKFFLIDQFLYQIVNYLLRIKKSSF